MRRRTDLMVGLADQEVSVAVVSDMVGHRNTQAFQPFVRDHVSKQPRAVVIELVREPRCRNAVEPDYFRVHRVTPLPAAMQHSSASCSMAKPPRPCPPGK